MKKNEDRGLTEINVTPLVDVCLVLLIIFMTASPFVMQSGIKVSTPAVQTAKAGEKASDIKVNVYLKNDSLLVLNDRPLAMAELPDSLRVLLAASKSKQVVISADDEVLHDRVILVMDQAKQCGAMSLSLVKGKTKREAIAPGRNL